MPDVHLEGTIWFYKKKDATILMKYVLTIDKNDENSNQFVLLDDNDSKLKSIEIKKIEKLSKFKDHSWEMQMKGKKCFRFKSVTEQENFKIFDIIDKLINQRIDEVIDDFSADKEIENNPETKLWSLAIDTDLTSPNFLKKFQTINVFTLRIDDDKLMLENESDTINPIVIPFNVIRRFGNTDYCLGIELGRSSALGSGVLALRSKNYHSKHLYKNLREKLGDMLYKSAFKRSDNEIHENSGSESDSTLNWMPNVMKNQTLDQILVESSPNQNQNAKHLDTPKNLPSIEKSIILKKKKVNFFNQLESETDESDYQDKYVPKYMSSKRMLSPSDEFFVDEDNSVYGRVKL